MFAELVELGKRIYKGHDALGLEKCNWDIVIDTNGNFINLIACDVVIEAEKLTAKKGRARLLLDKAEETLLGFNTSKRNIKDSTDNEDKKQLTETEKKHNRYIEKLKEYEFLQELRPIFLFYNKPQEVEKAQEAYMSLPSNRQKGNMTFMLDSSHFRFVSFDCVKDSIKLKYEKNLCSNRKKNKVCAICGTDRFPILDESHGSIKMPKGQKSGSMLVSYNTNAFESYNLKGNLNSGICTNCARNYVEALKFLTRSEWKTTEKGKKFKWYDNAIELSDDTLVVFWTKEPDENIDPFSDIYQPAEDRVRKLFSSIMVGDTQRVNTEVDNYFYCCTLSSSAARIAVKDWMAISISQYQKNIKQWFEDIATIKNDTLYYPGINSILNNCIKKKATPTNSDFKAKARLGTMLWHAALTNSSLPQMLLVRVLDLIGHEKSKNRSVAFCEEKSTIIRLILNRNIKNKFKMKEQLDDQNESKAYLCGRLFALVCKLQFKAQGAVNSSIQDRFFASASNAPANVMGLLLTKYVPIYEKKTKGAYAKSITEIATRIGHFPNKFTTIERGEFALGYYYQYNVKQNASNNN